MMHRLARNLAAVALVLSASPTWAQLPKVYETEAVYSPANGAIFNAVTDTPQTGPKMTPQLRGGQLATTEDWPASFVMTFPTPKGTAACTSALIGPEVLLTAAHCVPADGKVTLFRDNKELSKAECQAHPNYPKDASADFALCRLTTPFAAPAKFKFERVSTQLMSDVVARQSVLLSGYGCTSDKTADAGKSDGKYRIGIGVVDESSLSPTKKRGAFYYTGSEENNLFTVDDGIQTHANICPGDSGGPAFLLTGGSGNILAYRAIIAVNSRVFLNLTKSRYTGSLLSALGGPDFRAWALKWLGATPACGLQGALNCR